MRELDHRNFLAFISKLAAVSSGYTEDDLRKASELAHDDYPALVPLIEEYARLASRSKLHFSPKKQKTKSPTSRNALKRIDQPEMHLFDLLRSRKLFPSNQDLSEFAGRVLPGISRVRFSKLSMGDIAARIIEHLETLDPTTREKLENSMRDAIKSASKRSDKDSFFARWERIIKGIDL